MSCQKGKHDESNWKGKNRKSNSECHPVGGQDQAESIQTAEGGGSEAPTSSSETPAGELKRLHILKLSTKAISAVKALLNKRKNKMEKDNTLCKKKKRGDMGRDQGKSRDFSQWLGKRREKVKKTTKRGGVLRKLIKKPSRGISTDSGLQNLLIRNATLQGDTLSQNDDSAKKERSTKNHPLIQKKRPAASIAGK